MFKIMRETWEELQKMGGWEYVERSKAEFYSLKERHLAGRVDLEVDSRGTVSQRDREIEEG